MNPITHFFIGWSVASIDPSLDDRERALITFSAVVADVDGLGLVPEILTRNTPHAVFWYSDYHHALTHNLVSAAIASIIVAVASRHRMRAALLAFAAYHTHLIGDLVGSRGPDGYVWPIPYLPNWTWAWDGAWALNAWQNVVITFAAMFIAFFVALKRGVSPLRIFSKRADDALVATLRRRFPRDASPPAATSAE